MTNADAGDERLCVTVTALETQPVKSNGGVSGLIALTVGPTVSVCVVCCSTASLPHDSIYALAKALTPVAAVRAVVLSESSGETRRGVEFVRVAPGTKLSKIRWLADLIAADLICICDPDLTVVDEPCRAVLQRAAEEAHAGNEVVAFGVVEGRDDGTMLSRVIAVDKWLSHRVLRRCLWSLGVGITLPGQFLIVSPGVLRSLDPDVDSYLDDLYLGWVARRHRVRVHRMPVVVGQEDSRSSWGSLLTQRLRWMRGMAFLIVHLRSYPTAVGLLVAHYFAYHGFPILAMFGVVLLWVVNPLAGLSVFVGLASLLSVLSRRSLLSAVGFMAVFPVVHLLATLLWWVPASRSFLTRR